VHRGSQVAAHAAESWRGFELRVEAQPAFVSLTESLLSAVEVATWGGGPPAAPIFSIAAAPAPQLRLRHYPLRM